MPFLIIWVYNLCIEEKLTYYNTINTFCPERNIKKMEDDEERRVIRAAVKNLNARERVIVEMRFGLNSGKELTQKEVADALGISQSYISSLEKKIMVELRKKIAEKI